MTGGRPAIGSWRWHLSVVAVLACAIATVYAAAAQAPFVFDDIPHIVENRGLRDLTDLGALFNSGLQETRPVYTFTLALSYAIGGTNPLAYHLVSFFLHFCCALLVYALALAMRRDAARDLALADSRGFPPGGPEIAALLFAVHPLATESVAYAQGRSGQLVAFFGLASLLFYQRSLDSTRPKLAYVGAILCALLAMGSKESAVALPLLLAAYVVCFRHHGNLREALPRLLSVVPFFVCAAVVPLLLVLADNPHSNTIGGKTLPLLPHYLTQIKVIAYFFVLSFFPLRQSFDYDPPVSAGIDGAVLAAAFGLAVIALVAFRLRLRALPVAFGTVWFFVALAPTNPGIPFPNFMAERYLYLALIGICIGVGWLVAAALARSAHAAPPVRVVTALAIAACAMALAGRAKARARICADPLTLWAETVASSPRKARPHVNYGILLVESGELERGGKHLRQAAALEPADPRAQYNLGVYRERRGDVADALAAYRVAVQLDSSSRYRSTLARVASNHGVAVYRGQRGGEAERLFREAIAANGRLVSAHYNLAVLLLETGRIDEGRRELEEVVSLDPGHIRARARLADPAANLDGRVPMR